MINFRFHITLLLLILGPVYCLSQLSPGKLAEAHQHLEGLSNCTQCHDIGKKVPDQKCINCHDEIFELVDAGRGYHASLEVVQKTCVECHSDHHGLKFEMTRFDSENFNHDLAGYKLEGQHAIIDCRDCHQPDNISDPKIRERQDTYLGLSDHCLSCHDDFHQGSLSDNCVSCHDFDAFRPASNFDHNEADYTLEGAHVAIDCIQCHPMQERNGIEFQVFNDIEFNSCVACHADEHGGHLPGSCSQCHVEDSWNKFIGQNGFNHTKTNFELKGKHNQVICFDCHTQGLNPKEIFQDQQGVSVSDCSTCHDDVHDGKFGNNCIECHSETSFLALKNMDQFNHDVTDFPLQGLHQQVDCKHCHETNYTDEINFSRCQNCHGDFHEGEFNETNSNKDCNDCHTVERKFNFTTYGLEEHQTSTFALEGSHAATPCFACHISEEKWIFKSTGNNCVDCHENIHKDIISEKYFPNQDCASCHSSDNWSTISFDHTQTNWELLGQHSMTNCRDCHFEFIDNSSEYVQHFTNLSQDCATCHQNPHGTQFEEGGLTSCTKCHNTEDWFPSNFNHDLTNFPLDGKHSEVDCNACHKDTYIQNGERRRKYAIKSFECIDCHR